MVSPRSNSSSHYLGNTPAVCRASYIDPLVAARTVACQVRKSFAVMSVPDSRRSASFRSPPCRSCQARPACGA